MAHRRFSNTLERTYVIDGHDVLVRHLDTGSGRGMQVEIDGVPFEGGLPIRGVLSGEGGTELVTHLPNSRVTCTVIPAPSTTSTHAQEQRLHIFTNNIHYTLCIAPSTRTSFDAASSSATASDTLTSPMPARVLEVKVNEGEEVKEGQVVVVLESMKMEINIRAARDGKVGGVGVGKGDVVEEGRVLVKMQAASGE